MNKHRSLLFIFLAPFFALAVMCSSSPAADVEAILIETFPNTWDMGSGLTVGLVYDSNNDLLRYAHENTTESAPYPCIFDVAYSGAHPLIRSIDLSEENGGWPSELHQTNGAAFDRLANTYFLADLNGDLNEDEGLHDDFLIEVNLQGTVLNAWEMDDELESNGSSDGTAINYLADIAVIPGNPPRYFATALYDGNKVYEISLTRGGGWWAADSWHTVNVYEGEGVLAELSDNMGIDWDHENERFYHSDRYSSTVQVTDINMEPIGGISTFTCPTAGGFNSGITFIEGSHPQEIWVTDFNSDETSRFESPAGHARLAPGVPLLLLLDD